METQICMQKIIINKVDELFMDCVASLYGRNNLLEVIKKSAQDIFIPIAVGGGIRSASDASELLHSGADKVCINTAAVNRPKLITELAKRFGSPMYSIISRG